MVDGNACPVRPPLAWARYLAEGEAVPTKQLDFEFDGVRTLGLHLTTA